MNQSLTGKVALVTGARLAVNYNTDADGAQTTCERIRQAGGEAEALLYLEEVTIANQYDQSQTQIW